MKLFNRAAIITLIGMTVSCANEQPTSQVQDSIDDQLEESLGDWVSEEDQAEIEMLARSGMPRIYEDSNRCYGKQKDYLGRGADARAICVESIRLSDAAYAEVLQANRERFRNESDYDQRATRLYAFRHGGLLDRQLTAEDLEALVKAFDIPVGSRPSLAATPYVREDIETSRSYLGFLDGLMIGDEWLQESACLRLAKEVLNGADITSYSWLTEVTLYPGGGFTTSFHIVVSDKHLLFVKKEGWNS